MKHVYAVMVWPEYGMPRLSQEAYASLEKAQVFIESRSDSPIRLDPFNYEGRAYNYTIHKLSIR